MDITFKLQDTKFNYRVAAVIIHDGKLLVMKDVSKYYYLPGGRVKVNETAEEAISRELIEEMGLDLKIIRPLWLNQSFFIEDETSEKYHELCLYFLVEANDELVKLGDFAVKEAHKIKNNRFRWIDISSLKNVYFYPEFLKLEILNLPKELKLRFEYEYDLKK